MDEKRLDEIRHTVDDLKYGRGSIRYPDGPRLIASLKDLLASHAAQSARIAELEGEVGRLKGVESDFNSYLVESCKTVGADHVVDWDGENPRLALAARYALKQIDYTYTIDALRTRLDAIEKAAGEFLGVWHIYPSSDEAARCANTLAALLAEKKVENG